MPDAKIGMPSPDEGGRRRVYVIDDNGDMRTSLHQLLDAKGMTAWPFANAIDFLEQLPLLKPAPILLDIRMPILDGFGLLDKLAELEIRWPVMIMSGHGDIPVAVRAMKLGVAEFLEKPFEAGQLIRALEATFCGLDELTELSRKRDEARSLFASLTQREREVALALATGVANKIIAYQLSLSTRTVEMHRANALAKLRVKSVADVIALAVTAGLEISIGALPGRAEGIPANECVSNPDSEAS